MLSFKKNFLFIHIPKTGGTSLKNVLRKYEERELFDTYLSDLTGELKNRNWKELKRKYAKDIIDNNESELEKYFKKDTNGNWIINSTLKNKKSLSTYSNTFFHLTYSQYKEVVENKRFDDLVKFSIVRNPYDRLISLHLWQNNKFDRNVFCETIKKYAYILHNDWNPMTYHICDIKNRNNLRIDNNIDVINTIKSEYEVNESLGYQQFTLGETVDFVLKFETDLTEPVIKKLCSHLKVEYTQIENLNKSTDRPHYSYYYDKEMITLVEKYYKLDLDTFGYNFKKEN